MISANRSNQLIDLALKQLDILRELTRPMTNEERVFYLNILREGIKAAEDKFRIAPPESRR